ncbi:MAG: hypothetical protein OXI24_14695 [Candidatus Poribacteria bacterium]|nr:hypothetical protein [Candidatus Poribacteria bacterium]
MLRKNWYWIPVVFVMSIGSLMLLSTKPPPEPIKVYKVVTPDPKPIPTTSSRIETEVATSHSYDDNEGYNHEHFYETAPHSHAAETPISNGEYDWQDEGIFDSSLPKVDPWEQTYPEQETTAPDDTYPPRDWYKTKDPELRAEYFYAQLLKQFGDIPEIHIIGEHTLQMAKRQSIHIDKYIEYLHALQFLWPDGKTSKLIDDVQKDKARGVEFIFE